MKYIFIFFSLLPSLSSYSQGTFHKYYGGSAEEYGYSFKETSDGGFVVCGRTFSFGTGGWEGYVLKLDSDGDTLWTKAYGNVQYDEIQDIETTSDGGYIMTGHTWTTDWAGDVYLIKLDAFGNIEWDQTYGGATGLSDKGYSVKQTSDGGYVVSGTTETYGAGGDDVYVIKTNSTGAIQWTRTIGTAGTQEAGREIQQTSDGGYVIAGYTDGSGTSFLDVYLVKLNSSGVVQWSKTYGGSSYDFAYTVEETSDNGFILGATTNSFGAGDWDAYLIKTDSTGVLQWSKTYGLSGEDRVQSATQTSDGGYILCGRSNSFGAGNFDATLHKTDASGNLQWSKAYGGTSEDQGWYAREYSGGGFVLCGYAYSFGAGSRDVVMIKTDATGTSGCNETSGSLSTSTPSTVSGVLGTSNSGGGINAVPTAISTTGTIVTVQCGTVSCPVVAGFTTSNDTICEGTTVNFGNTSTGAISYQWLMDAMPFSTTTNATQLFNTAGDYQITLAATDGSCIDTISVFIYVNAPSVGLDIVTACDTYTWLDGNTYTSSINTPTWTLTNAQGCDSIITLDLTVNYSNSGTDAQTACDSYSWIDGNSYTNSTNTPTWSITNSAGCDSLVTLNLTINSSSSASIVETGLDSYTAPSGAVYTSSGIYNDTILNSAGCDSIIIIDLTLNFTGINELQETWIKIYPNPVESLIHFENLEIFKNIGQIKITNSIGQVLFISNDLELTYDVSFLPTGIYYIYILNTRIEQVIRFIKT
ncbi:MAG: T9SS type A sorting domain-containing protein [Crocinitomicaceae bacterium]|nr:T9SS type A sorting domain-containing protein [Crocinitomicaceae bacterium]